MPCNVSDLSLSPSILPAPPAAPGFGVPIAPSQIPFPDVALPDGIPEDILNLIHDLIARIPGGVLNANLDDLAHDLFSVIASLLNQLGPYLVLYNMFQALLNMVICVIDILCAIANPFAMISAVRRLFKQCLPDFLSLFPWFALIAMILALLLLLIALIEYLINKILDYFKDILANLEDLSGAVAFQDSERQLAAARKIAQLLCLIEQLFTILVAFQAIMTIIESLANLAGRAVCSSSSSSSADFDCCPDDVCPPFIANEPNGMIGTYGHLRYFHEVDNDVSNFPGLVLPPIRAESWQFYDDDGNQFNFIDIVTPINDNIFWPEGKSYNADSAIKKVPYTLDITLTIDPATFGHVDTLGSREFKITDIVVISKPTNYQVNYDGSTSDYNYGVLELGGGKVYESDGTTAYTINGIQATLNTFIHLSATIGQPSSYDGQDISAISYTLNFNYPILVQENLITLGCIPDVKTESEIINSTIDVTPVISRIGSLPNIGSITAGTGTLGCLTDSMSRIRLNVSPENVQTEQDVITGCLTDLRDQAISTYKAALSAGADPYQTTIEVIPEVQFVSLATQIKITLKDAGGTVISGNIPADAQTEIAALITADVSLGQISTFTFDGSDAFVANITSTTAGDGQITVYYNGNTLSNILNRDSITTNTSISANIKSYTFVGAPIQTTGEPAQRRNESDIANDI